MEVNIHEAKTHLLRLLERVALGEEVIIAKLGSQWLSWCGSVNYPRCDS